MRNINCAIKMAMIKFGTLLVSLLVGTVLVLSTSPALASGKDKLENEKAKVEIIKVEKDKDEKEMREEKKVEDKLGVLHIKRLGIDRIKLLVDEDILGEILEDED